MTLPNFIIVGAQKSGTTTLYDILAQHKDIYLSSTKESKFFVEEEKYNKGIEFYSNEYFSKYNGEKAIGEIDPEYIFFEDVPRRLRYDISKDLKLIFILRNPVARAYSHYLMTYKRGWEELSFEDAIIEEPKRIEKDFFSKHHQSYISRGYYSKQIKRYLEYFPKENMHFIIMEDDFIANKEQTIHKLLKFIDVKADENIDIYKKSNVSSQPRFKFLRDLIFKPNAVKKLLKPLIPSQKVRYFILMNILDKINQKPKKDNKLTIEESKAIYEKYYKDEIRELEKLLDRDLGSWYASYS